MNIYVILVGAFLIVLMVAFGNNPVEDAKRKRELEGSSDPLIHATEQYFKDKNRYHAPSSGAGGGPYTTYNNTGSASSNYPSYMMNKAPGAYPTGQAYPGQSPYPPQNTDSYYPPAPTGVPPSPLQQR